MKFTVVIVTTVNVVIISHNNVRKYSLFRLLNVEKDQNTNNNRCDKAIGARTV